MKKITIVPYRAMWKPEMIADSKCVEKFTRSHILEEKEKSDHSKPEYVLCKSIYFYLRSNDENFLPYKITPSLKSLIKRLYQLRKNIAILEFLYDNHLMCKPHIVYRDRERCAVLMLKDRAEKEITADDLIELLIPVYLLHREAERKGVEKEYYIGIIATRNERPLHIQRVSSDVLENLDRYIMEKVRGAILSLLNEDDEHNREICQDCEYVSSCSKHSKKD